MAGMVQPSPFATPLCTSPGRQEKKNKQILYFIKIIKIIMFLNKRPNLTHWTTFQVKQWQMSTFTPLPSSRVKSANRRKKLKYVTEAEHATFNILLLKRVASARTSHFMYSCYCLARESYFLR